MDDGDFIERRVRESRDLFASSVKEPTLCTNLYSSSLITEQDDVKWRATMKNAPYEANLELLDCVLRSEEPRKWEIFLMALEKSGYDNLKRTLLSPSDDDNDCTAHVNSIIQQFTNELAEGMNGAIPHIVPILLSKNILSEVDKDNIYSELTNKGDYQANLMLLDRMKRRAMPTKWYGVFLQALCDVNYGHLVEKIEPDFICKRGALFNNDGSSSLDKVTRLEESDTSIREHVISGHGDEEMDINDLAAPPVSPITNTPNITCVYQSEEEQLESNTNVRQQNVKQDQVIFRYQYLLINLGTEVLRKLLDVVVANDIVKHLTAKSQDIQQLILAKVITSDQKQLLPPIDNQPDSSKFDISLLSCVLRNMCGLRPPKDPVWMQPAPGDISVEADIARLRMCRNQLMHSDKLLLPETELNSRWKDLSTILLRLNEVCGISQLQSDINNTETIDIDERLKDQLDNTMKAWYESDQLLNQRIDKVMSEVTKFKQDMIGVTNEVTKVKQDLVIVKRKLDGASTTPQEIKRTRVYKVTVSEEDTPGDTNDLAAPSVVLDMSIPNTSEEEKFNCNINQHQLNKKPDMVKNIETGDDAEDNNAECSDDDNALASDCEETQSGQSTGVDTYKLRSYQIELAQNAISGKNTIICLETGAGKTWVALEIIKRHFKEGTNVKQKVGFMARTGMLLKQQADRLRRFLPMYQTKLIEDDDSKQLNMYMDINDIICFTPQILVNSLDIKTVKSVSEFSLLILDECHHTRGDEPYNKLMRRYLMEKSENINGLPQIIGLTASIGVGKSRSEDETVDYILRVMACLDAKILSTVERNKEELRQHTNMPEEETIPLKKTDFDPCKDVLLKAIETTEDLLNDHALMQPDIIDLITDRLPREKDSQAYSKWTVDVFKSAQLKVDDHGISRDICACARYLNTYNSALEINKLLRSKDVIKFLAEQHKDDALHEDKHTEMEKTLFKKLKDAQKKLQTYGKDIENPNVRTLSDTLKKMLDGKGEDSRAMVFVKTRATCRSLAEFLDLDLRMSGYKTKALYGKENRGGDDGMTESVQTDILEKFREGFYNVIVCTSVGNEGIDVPQCNIVISYEYSGDEITKIQTKGRARIQDATVTLMADERMLELNRINAYKVAMMYRALKRIKDLKPKYVESKVQYFQKEEISKHLLKVATEDYKKGRQSKEDHDILCGKCSEFACYVSDVRQMGSNRIVIDKEFDARVERKEHKRPKTFDELHKKYKMYCKKCGLDWGIIGIFKGLECFILKIENMKFRNQRTMVTQVFRKWQDQPYNVSEMTAEDFPHLLGKP